MLLDGQWSVLMICRMIMPQILEISLHLVTSYWHWVAQYIKFYSVNHSAKWGVAAFACTIILLHLQAGCAVASSSAFIYNSLYVFFRKKNYIDLLNDLNNGCNHQTMQKTFAWCLSWEYLALNFINIGIWKRKGKSSWPDPGQFFFLHGNPTPYHIARLISDACWPSQSHQL